MLDQGIAEERKGLSFQPRKLGEFVFGKKGFEQINRSLEEFRQAPEFKTDFDLYNKGREELMLKELTRIRPISEKMVLGDEASYIPLIFTLENPMVGMVHLGMFLPAIKLLGSDKQFKKYCQPCLDFSIIGCYAQTEIGHGSDVRNLETTAVYSRADESFLLNTPTTEAIKYWPGELGVFSNHALVFAQLNVDGACYGVQPFVVPIRDHEGRLLPGVQAGDLGPKVGFNAKDNGFLALRQVRVGRDAMLNKYVKVSREGKIEFRGNPKIGYATMMLIRKQISTLSPLYLAKVISIATKYSLKRRQFAVRGVELPLLDYQAQAAKVLPAIADYYAMVIVANAISKLANQNLDLIVQKDDDSLLNETHSVLSFTKVFVSETVLHHMEWLRLACGGHGFSVYSGLPSSHREYLANATHEGQNSVLLLQTAKTILKAHSQFLKEGIPMPGTMKYLENGPVLLQRPCVIPVGSPPLAWSLESLRVLLAQSSCFLLRKVEAELKQWKEQVGYEKSMSRKAGIRLVQLARAHSSYYYFFKLEEAVVKVTDEGLRAALFDLCSLFGVGQILKHPFPVLESQMLKVEQLEMLQELREHLLLRLRPDVLGFVDAMGNIDLGGSSLLGGDEEGMYQRMFDEARRNNSMNGGRVEVLPVLRQVSEIMAKL